MIKDFGQALKKENKNEIPKTAVFNTERKFFQSTKPSYNNEKKVSKISIPIEDPEDLLAPNDLKVIDKKREKIKKLMLPRMNNNPNSVALLKDGDLRYLFNLIDDEYFDSYLQDYIEDEKVNLVVRFGKAERTGGFCEINPPCRVDVMISRPIFLDVYIGGPDPINAGLFCYDGITCLMITMEHEMTHLFLNLFFTEEILADGPHGPLFRKTVHDVFGHKKTYHELLPPHKSLPSASTSWKDILNIGDKVRIKEKSGRLVDCEVVEINRRPNAKTFIGLYDGEEMRIPYDLIIYHYKNKGK
jgi:hypothetical protein